MANIHDERVHNYSSVAPEGDEANRQVKIDVGGTAVVLASGKINIS